MEGSNPLSLEKDISRGSISWLKSAMGGFYLNFNSNERVAFYI